MYFEDHLQNLYLSPWDKKNQSLQYRYNKVKYALVQYLKTTASTDYFNTHTLDQYIYCCVEAILMYFAEYHFFKNSLNIGNHP